MWGGDVEPTRLMSVIEIIPAVCQQRPQLVSAPWVGCEHISIMISASGLVTLIDPRPALRCPHNRVVTEGVSISAWARAQTSTS